MGKIRPWGYYPMYLAHNYGFLSVSASMEGRRDESLQAARDSANAMPPEMIDMMPGMEFFVTAPIFAMVRFGKFDELLDEPRPLAQYPVFLSLWLHGHGMALAAKGRIDEAKADHAELLRLRDSVRPELRAGNNAAKDVMDVAARVLAARIAEKQRKPEAHSLWAEAVEKADTLAYSEPNDWFYPVRHYQGALLLTDRKFAEAERVFRKDLEMNPANGWALFGLAKALRGQGKAKAAAAAEADFEKAWSRADIELTNTAY
jgi:tetratricopeptide (TPR) repeat protein